MIRIRLRQRGHAVALGIQRALLHGEFLAAFLPGDAVHQLPADIGMGGVDAPLALGEPLGIARAPLLVVIAHGVHVVAQLVVGGGLRRLPLLLRRAGAGLMLAVQLLFARGEIRRRRRQGVQLSQRFRDGGQLLWNITHNHS